MTIRKNILLVIVFVLLTPLLIPLTGYIIYVQPFTTKTITDIQNAPLRIRPELQKILTAEDRTSINEQTVILTVTYGDEGIIYINPRLREDLKQMENSWKSITAEIHTYARENKLAISTFSYKGKDGMVFFSVVPITELPLLRDPFFSILLIAIICMIIILVAAASLFLLSLRKKLNAIIRETNKIKEGTLDFSLNIPKDKELEPLFISLDKMRIQLIEENAQKSRFLMAISHDLKTPLTSIKGYLEAFSDGMAETREDQDKYLSIIKDKADILEQRIIELIDFAKMETVSWQKKFVPMDLSSFIKELSAVFAAEADIHGKQYTSHIELAENLMIKGDPQLLQRALENIFDNAVRYTDGEISIKLTATREDEKIIISLADSGTGIQQNDIPYIFEPFFRGSRGRNEKGFGLGLPTVKSIIEAHGGTINYRQSGTGGAEFIITLKEQEAGEETNRPRTGTS